MLVLDVGCGEMPMGNVNCDIKISVNIPLNFVLCDSQYLSFRNYCFDRVDTNHVIEHVRNPFLFLKEIKRVLCIGGSLLLTCPHRFSHGAKMKDHIHYFNRRWFAENLIGCRAKALINPFSFTYNIEVYWRKAKHD